MGEGAEQAQRIDCLLEEGRNAETILQHTKKQVFFAEKKKLIAMFWRTSGGGGQSRVEKAAESLPQVKESLNLKWLMLLLLHIHEQSALFFASI